MKLLNEKLSKYTAPQEAKAWSSQEINQRITEFANKDPEYAEFLKKRKNRENSSTNAIEFLERKYKLPGDNDWNVKANLVNQAKNLGFDGKGYDPAVLRLIQMVTENAHKNGIWVGICGELGADLTLTETFLAIGVDELSVTPRAVLPLRNAVRMTDTRETSQRILDDLAEDYEAR